MRRLEDLRTLARSRIARNFLVYSLDYGLRIFIQLGYFLVISRSLGPAAYGGFASITAITLLASTFSGIGCDQVLIRQVAKEHRPFAESFGNALSSVLYSSLVLVPLVMALSLVLDFATLSLTGVAMIAIADIVMNRAVWLANTSFQAHERAQVQMVINLSALGLKFISVVLAWQLSDPLTLNAWALWYLAGATCSAVLAVSIVVAKLGAPRMTWRPREIGDGFIYSLEFASLAGLRDLDKTVVVQTLGATAGGYYTAAFRIVDTASVPVRALLAATYTRYFHHSRSGGEAALGFARKVIPYMVVLCILVGLGLLVCAPVVPMLIGEDYRPAVGLIRILSIYPLLFGLSALNGDVLRALQQQRARLLIMLGLMVIYVPAIWLGTRLLAEDGAAIGRIAVQALLFLATGLVAFRIATRTAPRAGGGGAA